MVRTGGAVLRTADPDSTHFGLAQVRRAVARRGLALLHVTFAPFRPRPLLLSLVRLRNDTALPLVLDYTEIWEIRGEDVQAAEGACACRVPQGERALAEIGAGIRARVPEPLPASGLALEMRMVLPPREARELTFAYAAPAGIERAAALVRAWRGEGAGELERTVREWSERLAGEPDPVAAYRLRVR